MNLTHRQRGADELTTYGSPGVVTYSLHLYDRNLYVGVEIFTDAAKSQEDVKARALRMANATLTSLRK